MNEERKFYVYAYLRTRASKNGAAGTPYYIGKGTATRAYKAHDTIPVPKDKNSIVFLSWHMTEADSFQAEMLLIHLHGRIDLGTGCLRNRTDGGDGPSGLVHTEETRNKMKGRKVGEETRRKLSQAGFGRTHNRGRKHSAETIRKNSEVHKGRKHSDETLLKMSESRNGHTVSAETRQRISKACKAYWERKRNQASLEERTAA
jgi:NUMOD3 motif